MKLSSPAKNKGLSLIEVLVAFVIMVLVVTAVYKIFSGGLRNIDLGHQYRLAAQVAERQIAGLAEYEPFNEFNGADGEDGVYTWRMDVAPYDDPILTDAQRSKLEPYLVSVTVAWTEQQQERSMRLDTIRMLDKQMRIRQRN